MINTSALNLSQLASINSYKKLKGSELIELNYTADYKLDDFIDAITANKVEYIDDMAYILHDLLAPNSSLYVENMLSNDYPGCSTLVAQDGVTGAWLMGRFLGFLKII